MRNFDSGVEAVKKGSNNNYNNNMRWRRAFIPECLLLFLASFVLGPSPTFAMQYTKNSFDEKECEHVLECHTCSMDEKQDIRECGITGKIYTLTCPLDRDVVGG